MSSTLKRVSGYLGVSVVLLGLGSLSACLSDKSSSDSSTGGDGSAGTSAGGSSAGSSAETAGKSSSAGGGGSPAASGTVCATPIKLTTAKPGIADFDDYAAGTELAMWSFALGGDSATGVFAGPFGYGDRASGQPETFEMVDGYDSTYALGISDSMAVKYGGGMGLWLSDCVDASAFEGVSFWLRGNAPTGEAKLSLLMAATTSNAPAMAGAKLGTCVGTDEECLPPNVMVPVTDTWTEVKVAWKDVMPGSAAGEPVLADGHDLWQLQFDVGLAWVPDDAGVYQPTPSAYELAIDGVTFY